MAISKYLQRVENSPLSGCRRSNARRSCYRHALSIPYSKDGSCLQDHNHDRMECLLSTKPCAPPSSHRRHQQAAQSRRWLHGRKRKILRGFPPSPDRCCRLPRALPARHGPHATAHPCEPKCPHANKARRCRLQAPPCFQNCDRAETPNRLLEILPSGNP